MFFMPLVLTFKNAPCLKQKGDSINISVWEIPTTIQYETLKRKIHIVGFRVTLGNNTTSHISVQLLFTFIFLFYLLKIMLHPNKRFHVPLSCPFNISISYDFDCLVFFLFLFLPFSPFTEASEEPLVDLSDVLNTDADIFGMLGKPSSDTGASYISQAVTAARV